MYVSNGTPLLILVLFFEFKNTWKCPTKNKAMRCMCMCAARSINRLLCKMLLRSWVSHQSFLLFLFPSIRKVSSISSVPWIALLCYVIYTSRPQPSMPHRIRRRFPNPAFGLSSACRLRGICGIDRPWTSVFCWITSCLIHSFCSGTQRCLFSHVS